jgi:hypothetical protein
MKIWYYLAIFLSFGFIGLKESATNEVSMTVHVRDEISTERCSLECRYREKMQQA